MSLTAPNPIVKPFCNSGTQVSPPVGADTFVANQETGFPDSQATPLPAGTEVQQNQMNGVLKLYTSLLLWLNSGGQFTFNQAFSDANNGYALDNILWCASNSTFQRSLVANNTANFVTTPSYINDGINWIDVNNASFPDIQDNPTDGNVTIGGRIANSVNNIKTLGDDGKLSGMVTGNEGSILYVTEPDGETINTAVVNQYGYRPFHNGTATAILDPENTFAYVSELPVVNNSIKNKTSNTVVGVLVMNSTFNGINWSGTIHGRIDMVVQPDPSFVTQVLQLDALLGINLIDGINSAVGNLSFQANSTLFNKAPSRAFVQEGPLPNEITLELIFPSNVSGNTFVGFFSAAFNATSIT